MLNSQKNWGDTYLPMKCQVLDRIQHRIACRDANMLAVQGAIVKLREASWGGKECVLAFVGGDQFIDITACSNMCAAVAPIREKIEFLAHTHRGQGEARLSQQDIETAIQLEKPIICYQLDNVEGANWDYYDPLIQHPYPLRLNNLSEPNCITWLLGQEYDYGRCDCMQIVEDYYALYLDIKLRRSERRPEVDQEQRQIHGWTRFEKELPELGFEAVNEPLMDRLVTFSLKPDKPAYHVGVIIYTDEGFMLLHNMGTQNNRCSKLSPLKRMKYIRQYWEHEKNLSST